MPTLDIVALLLSALLFGGMAFFAGVMAPLIFSKLPAETAGGFMREVFPVYYLVMALVAFLAALAAMVGRFGESVILVLIAAGFLYARFGLMPQINRLRDAELEGNAAASVRFKRLHRASVLLNLVQLIAAGGVLIALAA
jgi:hypothetical protein